MLGQVQCAVGFHYLRKSQNNIQYTNILHQQMPFDGSILSQQSKVKTSIQFLCLTRFISLFLISSGFISSALYRSIGSPIWQIWLYGGGDKDGYQNSLYNSRNLRNVIICLLINTTGKPSTDFERYSLIILIVPQHTQKISTYGWNSV